MATFEKQCGELMRIHGNYLRDRKPNRAEALARFVKLLATVLETFFTIHPFKDGNGHTGRALIYVMLLRAGFTPVKWSIDEKQTDMTYYQALSDHRRGDPKPLHRFILGIIGTPVTPTLATPPRQMPAGANAGNS